jgi:hypothetical protein
VSDRLRRFLASNWLTITIAIISLIVTLFSTQRDRYSLDIQRVSDVEVVSLHGDYVKDIEVRYRGVPVPSLHVVELRVRNSGNRALARDDFYEPLGFIFGSPVVGRPVVVSASPAMLRVALKLDGDTVLVEPLLLNTADSFTFRALVSQHTARRRVPLIIGRIMNVRRLAVGRPEDNWFARSAWLLPIILGAIGVIAAIVLLNQFRLFVAVTRGVAEATVSALAMDPRVLSRRRNLANELNIAQHDRKANVLALRIRIEADLAEIARLGRVEERNWGRSAHAMVRLLVSRQLLPSTVATALADILPAFNRELHSVTSYLSEGEMVRLEAIALSIVAELESQIAGMRPGAEE